MTSRRSKLMRDEQRGLESPLATKVQRDRLARRPIHEIAPLTDDEDEDVADNVAKESCSEASVAIRGKPNRSSSRSPSCIFKPGVVMSSPLHDTTGPMMPSPQYSRIEPDFYNQAGISTVERLKEIREMQRSTRNSSQSSSDQSRGNISRRSNIDISSGHKKQISINDSNENKDTPKRDVPVIKRSLPRSKPRLDSSWLGEDDENLDQPKSRHNFIILLFFSVLVIVAGLYQVPESQNLWSVGVSIFLNSIPVTNSTKYHQQFLSKLNRLKSDFPRQEIHSWRVVGSSLGGVFKRNLTMPACLLLISNGPEDVLPAANCLASRLVSDFHAIVSEEDEISLSFDVAELSDLDTDSAKRKLFGILDSALRNKKAFSLLNLQDLRGNVSMALHSFCDEGSLATSFPMTTLVMTISSHKISDAEKIWSETKPESIADFLLTSAWGPELGQDKVSSLISRVAVSVVLVKPEAILSPEVCK